ncbi:hypothetical protein DEU56DRAFT_754357 [Suillus clintonianus]|uniref:uncharacterized protein n=1 Tax=Suillus clintonianus TaxID=1904413 RepID=UPI001B861A35|nr:uncharacterized protein DEU56DRAFT_754357 [Suillus clintonianus]KAG2144307.1 hypothetical protein DEU56DRAFT_754357 [Suillus clintonianus]
MDLVVVLALNSRGIIQEDRHTLNQLPIMILFADTFVGQNNVRQCIINSRVLAYSNLKNGRPWGLDTYCCWKETCQGPAYNIIFNRCGRQFYGSKWLQLNIKYTCLQGNHMQKNIVCPTWIHAAAVQNFGRLSVLQINIHCEAFSPTYVLKGRVESLSIIVKGIKKKMKQKAGNSWLIGEIIVYYE